VSLREALWHVDRYGFTCVDHVTMNFWPIDDSFRPNSPDLEQQFRYFEFSDHPGHYHQRDVMFVGHKVFPYKFLLNTTPSALKNAESARYFASAWNRWNLMEREKGWHRQYDEIENGCFLRDPSGLTFYNEELFLHRFLLQRLTGVGVFTEAPPWATPPMW
jgi:hypothetical protein